jgi:hypothetical protein
MDPEGNIYDMDGNFIGTANTDGLAEEQDDEQQIEDNYGEGEF